MKNFFKGLLYKYTYNLRLKGKLLISHGVLLLLPTAVVTGFFYARLYTIIINDSVSSEKALAFQSMNSIENLMDNAVHTAETVNGTGLVRDLLNPRLPQERNDPAAYEKRVERLYGLTNSLKDGSFVTDIRIFFSDSLFERLQKLNRPGHPLLLPLSEAGSWQDSLDGSDGSHLLFTAPQLSSQEQSRGGLVIINPIAADPVGEREDLGEESAYVAVYLSRSLLEQSLSGSPSLPESVAYLVNERGQLVASSSGFSASYFLSHEQLEEMMGQEEIFSQISFPDGPGYSAYFPIQHTDWYMVAILPSAHITDAGIRLLVGFVVLYLLFTALAIAIALILARSIANRIIGVALQMEHSARSGKPQPITGRPSGQDEIGILSDTYNYMALEQNRLMEREKEASEELRLAEFRALQAQINPHFLYNTLDMINWLSKTGRTGEVSSAIQALSRFYKLTLSKGGLMDTIRTELEHITLYIQLQNMRYDNCVQLTIDVPEDLYGQRIPKLTFQPLVENALLHGIRMTEKKHGTIFITGWKEQEDMVFMISDDGAGMQLEKLEALNAEMKLPLKEASAAGKAAKKTAPGSEPEAVSASRIGVYNTNLRLKILYGNQYGLSFESAPGRGTDVTIRLPAGLEE